MTHSLSHFRSAVAVTAALLGCAALQAPATTYYWDADGSDVGNSTSGANLGGAGAWDTSTAAWWTGVGALTAWPNLTTDTAVFSGAFTTVPVSHAVTVGSTINANLVSFVRSGYVLTGGDLTLGGAGAGLHAHLGESATIDTQLLGTSGLTKTGGGAIRLGNTGNNYTGMTTISNGSLIITDEGALGADSSAIVVTGFNPVPTSTNLRGFGGGSLVLDGLTSGMTIARDLSLQGQGPIADRGAALVSSGNNTLSGTVNMGVAAGSTAINTRIVAADGTIHLTGTLNVQGVAGTTTNTLGGVNQAGASFYNLTGVLSGSGTLEGSGGGTLLLNPSDASGFSGAIRVSGSAASGQSVVRITDPNVLGARTASGTSGVLDMNGGILAVLMDTPSVLSGGVAANVYQRASSTIYADQMPGGSAINGTVTFGNMTFEDSLTTTFSSRNGYGITFTTAPVNGGNANSTFNNNLQGNGLLTFTGNFWSNSDNTGSRTMTFGGNGNTLISGNILASGSSVNHSLTKGGSGTLTITSTGATLDGNVTITGGTLAINDFRSINNAAAVTSTAAIAIGSGGTSGTLRIEGNNVTLANLTTDRDIRLSGTTGGATILASQAGSSPGILLNGAITHTAGVSGNVKAVTLGGTNLGDNTLNGAIPNNTAGTLVNLNKIDSGVWVLGGSNTFTGTTTISNGTLKLKANAATSTILADTSSVAFNSANTFAGGTLELVGQNGANNVETVARLLASAGAGTITLSPGTGGTASLVFSIAPSISDGATVNVVGSNGTTNTVTFTGAATGLVSPQAFFAGSDFARSDAGVLVAPVYGADATFVSAPGAATLPAGQNNFEITGDITAQGSQTTNTLKFNGAQTLTLNGGATLTVRIGSSGSDGGILATGGAATITGGTGVTTGGGGSLTIRVNGASDSLTMASPLTSGTSGGLTKSGQGTLILTQNNALTGTVTINEGKIQLSGSGDLGGGNSLTMRQGTTLDLNGVTPTSNVNSFNNNGLVTSGAAGTVTFTIGGSNGTGTSFGIIEDGLGTVNVTKLGTGGQAWNGLSTYTGGTTIDSTGIVSVPSIADGGSASGIGASGSAAGNLVFTGASASGAFGGLSYTGANTVSTDRLFTFGGSAANSGVRLQGNGVNGASIAWSNPGPLAFGTVNVAQGLVLGGASTGDNRFEPQIADNGAGIVSFSKQDSGTWILGNSANSYTGATTIHQGRLIVAGNDAAALPSGSPLVFTAVNADLNGGVLEGRGTLARSVTLTPTAGTGTVSFLPDNGLTARAGSGGFAASAAPFTVDLGSVTWNSGGFLMNGSAAATLRLSSVTALADVNLISDIDLNGGTRSVQVDDNTSIGADFATLSGVLSGTGAGLSKTGSGILVLKGANSYDGNTHITAGTLVISSLGQSGAAGTTSVGDSLNANTNGSAITLGNGGSGGAILQYVGAGEISDRKIRLNATTGSTQIHSDGVGPIILTNVANDMTGGIKTLFLRGTNAAGNMVTSQLSDNGGALNVSVDSSAMWILTNGANDYTGVTTTSAGALGIGDDAALGASTLVLNSGNVFAYGADRTVANTVTQANNTTQGFLGDYSLTFSNGLTAQAAANNFGTNNNIAAGKALTFHGVTANSLTGNRSWIIDGPGETIIDGDFTTSTSFGVLLSKGGDGVVSLHGTGSNFNQNNATIDLDRGTLRIGNNEVIPNASVASGGVTFSPELATSDTAILDLNGKSETINAITAITDGASIIDNTSSSAASLTFGANNAAVNFGGGVGAYTIQNSGGGALSIFKTGAASATIPTGVTINHSGTTGVSGGTFTIASPVNATTGLSVTNSGSTLALTGGLTTSSAVASVVVEDGGVLNLLDGAGNKLSNLTTLQLGSSGGSNTDLRLNVGDSVTPGDELNTDLFTLLTGGTLSLFAGNQVTFNLTDIGLNASQTYDLISVVDGGLTSGPLSISDWILGATPGGFTSITLNVTDTLIQLQTGTLVTGSLYWRGAAGGGTDTTWNANANNWSLDKANTSVAISTPGQGTDVHFQIDAGSNAAVATTLEQNFKVNSLTFEADTVPANTPTSVSIAPGAIATARLEVAPQTSTAGIAIAVGGPALASISASVKVGADQTWTVADAASVLTLSGALQGEADIIKDGAGKVVLGAASDPTFNNGVTADVTIAAGTLELTNVAALGNTVNANLANVAINAGAFYSNSTAASTLPNPLTLGGGVLSAGGNTQTYSGAIAVSADSSIQLQDSNAASTIARSVILSGVVSGTGNLTVDGNTGTNAGNQINGTLLLTQSNSSWSGDLNILRGNVVAQKADALGSGDISFEFGKIEWEGAGGATYSINKAVTVARAGGNAIAEWNIDRTSGAGAFTVSNSGVVTLGGAGGTGELRVLLQDANNTVADFTGPVVLANDAAIHVRDSATLARVEVSGVISESGGARSLIVNGPAGGGTDWGGTDGILRLTGLNTFTGDVTVQGGVLEFDTVTNVSGGASALGNGTALTLGTATLSFIGSASQATDRPITQTGTSVFSANGTGGASITYNGAISGGAFGFTLTGSPGSEGYITSGISNTGATDATANGGVWTLTGATSVGDDFTVTGTSTVLNLNSAGALTFTAGASTSALLTITNGAVVNLGANDAVTVADFDNLFVGQSAGGAIATLNLNAFNQTTTTFILGERLSDREGQIDGTGTLTVTSNIDLNRGTVNANLGSTGSTTLDKVGPGTVTLKGDNSALLSTGDTFVHEGTLVLDYTVSNATKVDATEPLDMRGGALRIVGNDAAATSQTVAGTTLGSGGESTIEVDGGSGQDAVLNLGVITRANASQDGSMRFLLPTGAQSATHGITTATLNGTHGLLGLSGFATVDDGTGTWFATNGTNLAGGNIVALGSTPKNSVATWLTGDHITDQSTGFTGTLECADINSLRFDAAIGSDLTMAPGGVLNIASGGILITSNVGGTPSLLGGTLSTGVTELIVTQDSTAVFEIGADIRINNALTKAGAGGLLLTGNNVYTGVTEIQNGTVQVHGGNAIGDNSLVTLSASRNSTLQLLADETIGRLQGGRRNDNSDYGTVALGANTLTLNQSGSTTYAGFFTGSGGIVMNKGGLGNLNLTNNSAGHSGAITVNGGALQLSGAGQLGATAITIGKTGALVLDSFGSTRSGTRILDTTPITLHSADGAFSGQTVIRGLGLRTDQDTTLDETVGVVTAASGANYVGMEATSSSDDSDIIVNNLVRTNNATLNVRGTNLGGASSQENEFRIGDAGNQTAFIATLVGGGGASGTHNVSIVPWAIGDSTTGALGSTDMGRSLVTYVSGSGIRPLDLATEYDTIAAAATTDNARESLTSDLTGVAGTSVNSLVLDNGDTGTAATNINVTGAGAGHTLAIASGAMLFTTNSAGVASRSITLSGFDGISVGGTNEYVIHVVDPSAAANQTTLTATIGAPLSSTADVTKSGRGVLILTAANTAGGGTSKTTINEGTIEIADLDNIGGGGGHLVFAGGTLRLGAGFADDISTRTISYLAGGGAIDTNGVDLALANSVGSGIGGFTKSGAGNLTLNAAATYTGATAITAGTLTIGANDATGAGGELSIVGTGAGTAKLDVGTSTIGHSLVTASGSNPSIVGTGSITASAGFVLNHTGTVSTNVTLAGAGGLLKLNSGVAVLSGANTYTGPTELQNGTTIFDSVANIGGGASSFGAPTTVENGVIRVGLGGNDPVLTYTGSGHSTDRILAIQGAAGGNPTINANGAGALVLGMIQNETPGSKTLTLTGTSAVALANSVAGIDECASGALHVTKSGVNTWVIAGASTYTGNTLIAGGGVLRAGHSQSFGAVGSVTLQDSNSVLELANGVNLDRPLTVLNNGNAKTLRLLAGATSGTYSGDVAIGENSAGNFVVAVESGGALAVSGMVSSTSASALAGITKTGVGTLSLTNANTYRGATAINDGIVNIQNASALGAASEGTTVASGATLQIESGIAVGAEALTLSGAGETGQNGALVNVIGTNSWAGTVTLGAASTISTEDGSLTLAGGVSLGAHTLTATGDSGGQTVITGDISGTGGLVVSALSAAQHIVTLDPDTTNSFSGSTAINNNATLIAQDAGALGATSDVTINTGGTLLLAGTGDRISDGAAVNLSGGMLNSAGLIETTGTLTLSLSSVIDFASTGNQLTFGDSAGAWSHTLSIWNWSGVEGVAGGPDRLLFNSFANIDTNLAQISFYSDSGSTLLGSAIRIGNEVLPVPEPTGVAAGLALFGLAGWRERRLASARRRDERNASRGRPTAWLLRGGW